MKHKNPIFVFSLFVFTYFSNFVFASQTPPIQQMRTPILFEKNIGQEDPSVKYFARGLTYNTLLSEENARFRFRDYEFTIALEGSNPNSMLKNVGSAASRIHYYAGQKESNWKTDVPAFGAAMYKDVYRGIDWKFYEAEGLVEFDFVVAPGADASQVRMVLKDADAASIDLNGDLIVTVQSNEFRLLAPVAYQCESNECDSKTMVKAEYILAANHKIVFKLGSHDPNKTLVIDPKIAFGTMLGGNTFDNAFDVAVDTKGNFYVVGYTEANTRIPGNGDGFVHKFSPTGSLIWTTFLVGSSGENASSIAVNPAGICFVGGSTSSRDFPIVGAFQPNFGGSLDGFIVKLAANGTIMRSSFLGGSGRDGISGVELGTGPKLGNGLYLFGTTESRNFPKKNATQQQFGGGRQDGFLTIVHSLQFQQLLSTYVGLNGSDVITSLALNKSRGDLYAAVLDEGGTEQHFIDHLQLTPASLHEISTAVPPNTNYKSDRSLIGGLLDGIVEGLVKYVLVKIVGSGDQELGVRTALINAAQPILFLATSGCVVPSTNCRDNGALVLFNQDLNFQRAVNFGGNGPGSYVVNDLFVNKSGRVYMVGDTLIKTLPVVNAIQAQHKGGWEGFVLSLAPGTFQPTFYSYLGGPAFDFALAVAVDNAGNIFVVGQTSSKNFPTTPGAPKRTVTGTADGFVMKITP